MVRYFKGITNIKHPNSIYVYSVLVGIICGVASMIFSFLMNLLEAFFLSLHMQTSDKTENLLQKVDFATQHTSTSLIILLLPTLGGLAAGLIIHYFCKDASGTGTDEMIHAFHFKEGKINTRTPLYKGIATLFTVPTGGSGGKEGPISLIGAGIGVWFAGLVKAGARARRTLLLAGTAAGLGSVFRSPLGGALTAAEMVYKKDIESDALIPCFISSVTAYLVYISYAGAESPFHIIDTHAFYLNEIPFYLLLGALCFGFGFLFIKGFNNTISFFGKLKIVPWLKPAIGGLLTGCVGLLFFEVTGMGNDFLEFVIAGHYPDYFTTQGAVSVALTCLAIAFLKIVSTTLTIGSGGSAGIFGPSLFIGAMLGAAVGIFTQIIFPHQNVSIASFMVIGMGAFYAGVAHAPIAGIIMIIEMSGNYTLLPPIIIVSIFTFLLSRRISFYKNQVDNRFKSPAHSYNMRTDVLENNMLNEQFPEFRNIAVVNQNWTFTQVKHYASQTHASDFVVVDDEWNYAGMISLRLINVKKDEQEKPVKAYVENIPSIESSQSLSAALNVILEHDIDKVAVIENNKVAGYVRYRDIFEAYNANMKQL
ncbi:MAG TPA: chloride channel protein [Bacteroidia bacterium]|jgi:CIC family chloride channel protein|nr:chloride channel protein [Bacteroidia bacterium]